MESARKILQFARPGTVIEFAAGSEKEIGLQKLINRLNFINFQEDSILVNFKHAKYPRTVSLEATPLPCLNNKLECHWTLKDAPQQNISSLVFENIFVLSGHKLIVAVPELITLGDEGAVFLLPDKSLEMNYRKSRRHPCQGITVQLLQNGVHLEGTLLDFSALSFRVETQGTARKTFHWINDHVPVQVVFRNAEATLYSAACRITSQTLGQLNRIYVLEPMQTRMQRFRAKEVRSQRHELLPLPNAVFKHPFSGKSFDLKVVDISGSGFSVHEELECSVLLPGMMIPELELRIGNGFSTTCLAQVIYREENEKECAGTVKCGLSFLDMDIRDHVNLLSLLYLAKDKHSYVSNQIDMDELWQFFFESGFIYPEKYNFVQSNKVKLKETYQRLYTENPSIARHFIYHENGSILGHLAMLRYYQVSWLVHHHASNKSESTVAGLVVLNQLAHSINDSYNLQSSNMKYIICYFRPENRFPNRVFGGAVKAIDNPKGCSTDTFAYFHYHRTFSENWNFSGPWSLARSTQEDLLELEGFYEQVSGGLMLNALDLEPALLDRDELSQAYRDAGFNLKRQIYTLKKHGSVKAVIMVNISDAGLNLSDLTNCIKVMVLDQEQFPKDILFIMLSILTHKYRQNDLPVLLYPVSYAETNNLAFERKYTLWAFNAHEQTSTFINYLEGLQTHSRSKRTPLTASHAMSRD